MYELPLEDVKASVEIDNNFAIVCPFMVRCVVVIPTVEGSSEPSVWILQDVFFCFYLSSC